MKALVYTQPYCLEMQELPRPQVRPDEVLLRVRAAGVCGSDLDGFLGKSKKRVPPLVLGHEFSGEIAEAGKSVINFRPGDAVAVYPLIACGDCRLCESGRENICPERKVYGLDFHGALAEYVSVPEHCLFRVPPGMSYLEGSLVEPLANAINVMKKCPQVEGQTGLVYGAGPIGMFVFLVAKHLSASKIAVVDLNPHRLSLLKQLGADLAVNASEKDPVEALLEWSHGKGADFSIDAVGSSVCRQNTITCTAWGGTSIWIGLSEATSEIDARSVVTREVQIKGSYAYTKKDFAQALELLEQKALPVDALISISQLEQGQKIFDELASGHASIMKAVFLI